MIKIDCKKYADDILEAVSKVPDKGDLLIVSASEDAAFNFYTKGKLRDSRRCGINTIQTHAIDQSSLEQAIRQANHSDSISGIILQYPLPDGLHAEGLIAPDKDVDGFEKRSPFRPCTVEGILYILKKELGNLTGKNALVVGRSKLVGKPVADLLLAANCTVTIAHSKTKNLEQLLSHFDIIVSAAGAPDLIDLKKCNAEIVVDVGTSVIAGKLCGDCFHFDQNEQPDMKVIMMPNGIGLLTRAVLMAHVAHMPLT